MRTIDLSVIGAASLEATPQVLGRFGANRFLIGVSECGVNRGHRPNGGTTQRREKTMTTITTGTSGPRAWKIALVAGAVGLAALVVSNLPQTSSDTTDQNVAATATATLPESVTGFEYNDEPTAGQAANPGVTTQYAGNSGELFPYENGPVPQTVASQGEIDLLAPVITQEFLDGPSSGIQGTSRVDPGAAVAAGLSPGAIDAVVGGTSQSAPTSDNLADARDRASVAEPTPPQAFAASDEALVNPVSEVNAGQMIQDLIDAELAGPPQAFAASDDALARGASLVSTGVAAAATNARWEALAEAYRNGTIVSYDTGGPDPVTSTPPNSSAEAGLEARWEAYRDAVNSGSAGALYESSTVPTGVDPADSKFLGTQQ
jgi:hypothetical protein